MKAPSQTSQTNLDRELNKSRFDPSKMIVTCGICYLENYLPKKDFFKALYCCHCKVQIWDEDKANKDQPVPEWLSK